MSDLPRGWAWTTLGEIGSWYGGGTPSKRNPAFWEGGTIPWLSPKDMGDSVLKGTQDRITEEAVAGSSTSLVPADSVVVVVRSGILERTVPIALVPFETTLNQDMKAIVPHSGVDSRWLLYTLQSQMRAVLDSCRKDGTTVASLDTAKLQALPILLPPLAEQHRIVEALEDHLSRLDAAEELAARSANQLAGLRNRLLIELLQNTAHRRLPLAGLLRGKPENGKSVPTSAGGFPVLRLNSIRDGQIDLRERKDGEWTAADAAKYLVRQGDVLLCRGNGSRHLVGRAGLVTEIPDPVAFPDTMIRLSPDTDQLTPEYLLTVWNAADARSQIERAARTTAGIYKVSQPIVGGIELPVPKLEDQRRIVQEMSGFDESAGRLGRCIRGAQYRSAALRRALLNAAFNGELVDQDRNDESADVALSRLRNEAGPAQTRAAKRAAAESAKG